LKKKKIFLIVTTLAILTIGHTSFANIKKLAEAITKKNLKDVNTYATKETINTVYITAGSIKTTPLIQAVISNNLDIVQLLVKKGAKLVKKTTITPTSLLHIAKRNPEIFYIIFKMVNKNDINVQRMGDTILSTLIELLKTAQPENYDAIKKDILFLVNKGVDIEKKGPAPEYKKAPIKILWDYINALKAEKKDYTKLRKLALEIEQRFNELQVCPICTEKYEKGRKKLKMGCCEKNICNICLKKHEDFEKKKAVKFVHGQKVQEPPKCPFCKRPIKSEGYTEVEELKK